jgi:maspardin
MRELLAQLEARYQWRSLVVDGQEWRWLDTQGDGPVTLLLPGSVGDGAMFVRTLLFIGQRMRLIAVTYPALSDPAQLADGLAAVADHLALSAHRVVSSSFSAYTRGVTGAGQRVCGWHRSCRQPDVRPAVCRERER